MSDSKVVTWGTVLVTVGIVLAIMLAPAQFGAVMDWSKSVFISQYGFIFTWSSLIFLAFLAFFVFSKHGNIKLGKGAPKYNRFTYYSMMFSTGMGVSMIYYGVLEPMYHQQEGMSERQNMVTTFFDWGLNAWAVYAVVGVAFGYLLHVRGEDRPLNQLFKSRALNNLNTISLLFSTIIGLTLSFVYAVGPISSGFKEFLGVDIGPYTIIALLTLGTVLSAITGVDRGVKWLSRYNVIVALSIMAFVAVSGTFFEYLWKTITYSGSYLLQIIPMSVNIGSTAEEKQWLASWPYAYYAAWVGWALFVGAFVARISYGRTIRELILGCVLFPTIISNVWFTVFGVAGLQHGAQDIFQLLANFPGGWIFSVITLVSVILFFITGHDSAGITVESMTAPRTRVFWIVSMGVIAAALNWAGGDVVTVTKTLVAVSAVPVLIGVLCILFGFLKIFVPKVFLAKETPPV